MTNNQRGLYEKYRVERIEDPTGKHDDCRYFVLDPLHDRHAVGALQHYADQVRGEFPDLAADLDSWLRFLDEGGAAGQLGLFEGGAA